MGIWPHWVPMGITVSQLKCKEQKSLFLILTCCSIWTKFCPVRLVCRTTLAIWFEPNWKVIKKADVKLPWWKGHTQIVPDVQQSLGCKTWWWLADFQLLSPRIWSFYSLSRESAGCRSRWLDSEHQATFQVFRASGYRMYLTWTERLWSPGERLLHDPPLNLNSHPSQHIVTLGPLMHCVTH